eukprot:scaffold396239_cov56-Cyclotella_meneghiniana.AAC.6
MINTHFISLVPPIIIVVIIQIPGPVHILQIMHHTRMTYPPSVKCRIPSINRFGALKAALQRGEWHQCWSISL